MSGLMVIINSIDVTSMIADRDTPEIEASVNARGTFRATLKDRASGSYRPALGHPMVATLNGTSIFGGVVQTVEESEQASGKLRLIEVTATDYSLYLDIGMINGIVGTTGSTLRDVVDGLLPNVGGFGGITRDPSMVTGPTINAQGFPFKTIRQAFNILSSLTGYSWRLDSTTRVLYWKLPSALDAPFNLDTSNVFDMQLTSRSDLGQYANAVWLQFGGTDTRDVTRTIHGDGSTRLFPLTGQILGRGYNLVTQPASVTVTISGTPVTYPVGTYGVDTHPPYNYFYRASDPTYPFSIIQDASQPVLGTGDTLVATFSAQFPGAVYVDDGGEISARGTFSIIQQDAGVYDVDVAIAEAQGILRRRLALPREITATTMDMGLQPLMALSVTWSRLGISGTYMVTSSRLRRVSATKGRTLDEHWAFEHTLIEGNEFQGNWIDYFLQLDSQGSGSASGGSGVISTGGVSPAAVVYANWGGSRDNGIAGTTSWVDVKEWRDIVLSQDARVNVRVDLKTQDASVSVKPRVYDYTAAGAVVTGTTWNGTAWAAATGADQILSFDGSAGHRYRLQLQPGTSSNDHEVFVVGVGA